MCASVPPLLDKAEKWLHVKDDPHYSFVWIMYVVNQLASIEAVMNGEAPGREVIHQALDVVQHARTERMARQLDPLPRGEIAEHGLPFSFQLLGKVPQQLPRRRNVGEVKLVQQEQPHVYSDLSLIRRVETLSAGLP